MPHFAAKNKNQKGKKKLSGAMDLRLLRQYARARRAKRKEVDKVMVRGAAAFGFCSGVSSPPRAGL